MEEGYHQRYIAIERENIRRVAEGQQARAGTASRVSAEGISREQQAILKRFLSEYEGMVTAGEKKIEQGEYNDKLKDLVMKFVKGEVTEDGFKQEKNQILGDLKNSDQKLFEREGLIADNLLETARELKVQVAHAGGLVNVDLDIQLTVGRARAGTRTEEDLRRIDKFVRGWQEKKVLNWGASPVFVATVAGGAYSILNNFARIGGGKIAALATWGASVLAASGFAAARRGTELKRERAMHARQRAMSMDQDEETAKLMKFGKKDTSRREKMDTMTYQMEKAQDLLANLHSSLADVMANGQIDAGRMNQARLKEIIGRLAEIDARTALSDTRNLDLIAYSKEEQIEQERTALALETAKAKVELAKFLENNTQGLPQNIRQEVLEASSNRIEEVLSAAGGINEKDKEFVSFRRKEMIRSALTAAAMGVGIGTAMQEGIAYFSDNQQGWIEGMIKGRQAKGPEPVRLSSLEALRAYMSGDLPKPVTGGIHEVVTDGIKMKIPDETSILQQGNQEFLVDSQGNRISEIVRDNSGAFSPQTAKDLADHGFRVEDHVTSGSTKTSAMEYFKDELGTHKRVDWHDEPGKRYSEFFKKLIEFEGKQQMLYMEKDASGQVYVNVDKIVKNLHQNLDGALDQFGRNPDGSFDSKLAHLRDELTKWRADGTLKDHLQVAIIPTEEANKKGLSMLVEGAGAGNKLALPKEVSDMFKTPESLKYLHHPVKYIEFRIGGHVIATTVGENMADITVPGGVHTPDIISPVRGWEFVPPPHLPFAGRRPIEPTRGAPERPPYPYPYGYGGEGYPYSQEQYYAYLLQDMSPRIRENPGARLNPEEEIEWYFSDQDRRNLGYNQELQGLSDQEPEPMSKSVEGIVALAVAGHEEHKNIYRTLETYAVQRRKDGSSVWKGPKSKYEILIYVNWPSGTSPEKTLKEIEKFESDHPNIPIRVYKEEIKNGKVEVGWYKKKAFDLGLLRNKSRKSTKDILLIANDADMTYTAPTYLEDIREFMKSKKGAKFDMLRGRHDLDPEAYEKNPTFHAALRFWEFMEAIIRSKEKNVEAQGRNTVMRGSVYAAVGGNRTREFWADIEFTSLLRAARRRKDVMAYMNRAWVMVDPRRELDKFKSGELIAYTWSDFNTRKVRGLKSKHTTPENISAKKLASLAESSQSVTKFRSRLEDEIQAIIRVFGPYMGYSHQAALREGVIRKAADHLGVRLDIKPVGKKYEITILDTVRLRERLARYKEKNLKETKIKNHPLNK